MRTNILRESLPYFFIIGMAYFMFRGIFASGFMSGYDNSFHYYDAYYLTETLLPKYHWINGWSMRYLGGFPVLVDYYQIGFLLIAFFNKALFLPLNLSYKLIVLLSYIMLGAGFYKMASYRFGKTAALFTALCLMLQKDIYCDRILGGIWSNYLAIGLFFIFFHMLDKFINGLTIKKALALGLLLGVIILTHIFVAIFAFILLFIYAIPYEIRAFKDGSVFRKSLIYFLVPMAAFLVSAYYLHGFFVAKDYFVKLAARPLDSGVIWGLKSFFSPLASVNSVSTFMINAPVIARIIFGFFGLCIFLKNAFSKKEENSNFGIFLWSTVSFIAISSALFMDILPRIFPWWHKIPFVATLQISRFLIYIQIGMYILAAYGAYEFLKRIRKRGLVILVFACVVVVSAFFHYTHFGRHASQTLEESPAMADIYRLWQWVNNNVSPKDGRIVYQNTVGNNSDAILGRSDVFALSAISTKVPQIGVGRSASPFPQEAYMRTDHGSIFGEDIDAVDDKFIKERMAYFNAGYIVTCEPRLRNKLKVSGLFIKRATFGGFDIFRLKDFNARWITFEKEAGYKIVKFEDQKVSIDIDNRAKYNKAFLKVAYHPIWKARSGVETMKLRQDKYGLMEVLLPEKGSQMLELSFNSLNVLWVTVSLASALTCLAVATYRKA